MTIPGFTSSTSPCKIAINGFGRIGRAAFRASLERDDVLIVAINHTVPSLEYLLHCIKYDSTHGLCRQSKDLSIEGDSLMYKDRKITLFSQRDPSKIDWKSCGAEYILECTGKMLTHETAYQHITSGAKKVIMSAPAKDAKTKTIVVGVNRRAYDPSIEVVSNASCTTNCLAPLAKVLNDTFGIEYGMMTTVHASTSSQHILDGYSKKSKRLGRSVAGNIIPTTTGAATAVRLVLPELDGKFSGISVRVPTNNVSMVDLTVSLSRPVADKEELLHPLREAASGRRIGRHGPLTNVIAVNDDELVSSDFLGWQQSCIIDSAATIMLNPTTAKIVAWYDNEYMYAVRLLDLAVYMYKVDQGVTATPGASRMGSPAPSGRASPVLRAVENLKV